MDRLPPAYSETLSVGESRIEHNPSRRERRPRETWLKTEGSITIALSEQTKDIDVPRYVRRDHIHGAMLLDNREVVSSVTMKSSNPNHVSSSDPAISASDAAESIIVLTSVKTSPEEWRQTLTVVNTKPNVNVQPIHCNLFIPAVQTFSVSDSIPFHIQMTAPSASLRLFFIASTDPSPSTGSPPSPTSSLVVNLVRQISVELNGKTSIRNIDIGSSRIRSVPPPLGSTPPHATQSDHMDWEGEVICNPDVAVGGFAASGVTVKVWNWST
ncbi:hypothetical protein CPB85DRAFT_1250904 [Mucidula mucida]|nr:hypothetical protein CPB85DRAFT_1250904 [Mucidula mucida]